MQLLYPGDRRDRSERVLQGGTSMFRRQTGLIAGTGGRADVIMALALIAIVAPSGANASNTFGGLPCLPDCDPTFEARLWAGGVVPYEISPAFSSAERRNIVSAMLTWSQFTGVRFVPRSGQDDFIHFNLSSSVCDSPVGKQYDGANLGGEQIVNLQHGCALDPRFYPQAQHEIGHAMGLNHEMTRPDREQFVGVNLENVDSGKEHNFNINDDRAIGRYDFKSVMHYILRAFSRNGLPTLTLRGPYGQCSNTLSPISCQSTSECPASGNSQCEVVPTLPLSDGDLEGVRFLHGRYNFGTGGSTADRLFATADVNGDGRSDLVKWELSTGNVTAALFGGLGICTGPPMVPPPAPSLTTCATDATCQNACAFGQSCRCEPTFALGPSYYFGSAGNTSDRFFEMADVSGDGRADLVKWELSSGYVTTALANPSGGFGVPHLTFFGSGGSKSDRFFAVGDVSGDGKADLVRWELASGSVVVALADGAGGFGSSQSTYFGSGGSTSDRFFILADIDGDHREDIVKWELASGSVVVALSNGTGGFGALQAYSFGSGGNAGDRYFRSADMNGDGKADIVKWELASGDVTVALSAGADGFSGTWHYYFGAGGNTRDRFFGLADMNHDGRADLVKWEPDSGGTAVAVFSNGSGFGSEWQKPLGTAPDLEHLFFQVADLDGDGAAEVVGWNLLVGGVNWASPGTPIVDESCFRYLDLDGDGFGDPTSRVNICGSLLGDGPVGYVAIGGDCIDRDGAVSPGAVELCNGLDDNCDGAVPENELDRDGDGYSECQGDCNDADARVNPGATETCNGIDDNCDQHVDEGILSTFYRDADGDGRGGASETVQGCSPPPGYVVGGTDCNDGDATLWRVPGEASSVHWIGKESITWDASSETGGTQQPVYDTIRSTDPSNLGSGSVCVETNDGTDLVATDTVIPPSGTVAYYLVREENACGSGSLGNATAGARPPARDCVNCAGNSTCDDHVSCTSDSCDPIGDCRHSSNDADCDDGRYCNGQETCNGASGCAAGSTPCPGQECIESTRSCTCNSVGLWHFDGDYTDASGSGNPGTPAGNVSFVNGSPLSDGSESLWFIGGHVVIGNNSSLWVSGGDFTVEAWVKIEVGAGTDQGLVEKMAPGPVNANGWRLFLHARQVWFCLGAGGGSNGCASGLPTQLQNSHDRRLRSLV